MEQSQAFPRATIRFEMLRKHSEISNSSWTYESRAELSNMAATNHMWLFNELIQIK